MTDSRTIYWKGSQWCVTDDGLETIKPGRYEIEAERLGDQPHGEDEREPSAERMRHVGMKTWIDLEDFAAAFAVALVIHAGRYPSLPRGAFHNTLANLRYSKIHSAVYEELKPASAGIGISSFDGFGNLKAAADEMDRRHPDRSVFKKVVDLPPRRGEP